MLHRLHAHTGAKAEIDCVSMKLVSLESIIFIPVKRTCCFNRLSGDWVTQLVSVSCLLAAHSRTVFLCLRAQEGAVVALFKICRQDRFRELYAHALRTVASICCVEEGIDQLDKVSAESNPPAAFQALYTSKCATLETEILYTGRHVK